jgi:hypothetical protein
MVPPHNLSDYLDELHGVVWAETSITANWYTDTRVQGKLVFVDDGSGYIRNSWIRIVYEIPEWEFEWTLGTFVVTNDNSVRQNNRWKTTLTLNSALYAMNLHKPGEPLVLAASSSALTAMEYIFEDDERQYEFIDPNDEMIAHTQVLEAGQSELARLYAVANLSDNRVDVNGNGYVVVGAYVPPADRSAVYEIDLLDPRGVAYDGLTRSTDWLQMPSEAVVVYKARNVVSGGGIENYEITATATVSDSSHASTASRGYTLTDYHNVTDLNPGTLAAAQRRADEYLTKASVELCEWKLKTKYLPRLWAGDVVNLVVPDGVSAYTGTRKCLVKSIDITGPYLDMTLTLKEVSSGDGAT